MSLLDCIVGDIKEVKDKMTYLEHYAEDRVSEMMESKAIQLAKKLLLKNLPIEEISELAELSIDRVRELKSVL